MAVGAATKVILVGGRAVPEVLLRSLAEPGEEPSPEWQQRLVDGLRSAGFDAELVEQEAAPAPPPSADDQVRALLDGISEGVCLADPQGRMLWSNGFFRRLPGALRGEIADRMHEAARAFAVDRASGGAIRRVLRREIGSLERGAVYELEMSSAPAIGRAEAGAEDGGAEGVRRQAERLGTDRVTGIVRDITRSRAVDAKLDAIDRAGYQLVRFDAEAVKSKRPYERLGLLEERIVGLMHDVLSYDHFAIFLIDAKREKLELVISAGLPPEIQDLDLFLESEGSGISGHVAATGESYICRDALTDDRFIPGLSGARSSLTVPLRMNDRIIGILDIESKAADAFDEEARQFVEIFGRYVALALHMLNLLVVERSTTNESVSDRVLAELREPLDDIVSQLAGLEGCEGVKDVAGSQIGRIRADVDSIRARIAEVASGPQTLLGVDRAMESCEIDPLLLGKRVLVADDAAKVCKVIGAVLRARGASVVVCESGESAIGTLDAVGRGEIEPFALVLSDIQMPDRNGYEVFSTAKKYLPNVPVILMTGFGYDPHHSIVRASQQGLSSVLFKPFEVDGLIEQVHAALKPDGG